MSIILVFLQNVSQLMAFQTKLVHRSSTPTVRFSPDVSVIRYNTTILATKPK